MSLSKAEMKKRKYGEAKESQDMKCWKCNQFGHSSKSCPNIIEMNKKTTCFGCRRVGHSYASCPYNSSIGSMTCYTCGGDGHASRNCPTMKSKTGTPDYSFAECFICKQKGHISSQCSENTNKVFPKGGSCFRCGSTEHMYVSFNISHHISLHSIPFSLLLPF